MLFRSWCAQHDRETLAPAKARAYELPSLSGQESDDIVLFLMSLSKPTPEMIASIDAAIEWFKESEIKNIKKEYFTNADGKKDYRRFLKRRSLTNCGMNKNKVKSFYLGILILVCASHPYTFWLGRGFNF